MAVDNSVAAVGAAVDPEEPALNQPPPPAAYKVARSMAENKVLNTIDIYGEKPFSV
jgi:hypothetical protein